VVLCVLLTAHSTVWAVAGACFVLGMGLGLAASPTLVAVQSVVGWDRRGVVTGSNMFFRSLGSAVGVAVFGAIANARLSDRFTHPPAELAGQLPRDVDATSLVLGGQGHDGSAAAEYARAALFDATHHVFVGLVFVAVMMVAALLLMPRRTEQLTFD
jgi:hypothetical protein